MQEIIAFLKSMFLGVFVGNYVVMIHRCHTFNINRCDLLSSSDESRNFSRDITQNKKS